MSPKPTRYTTQFLKSTTPFGTTSYRAGRNATETSLKRYRYVGKERYKETGFYYYGARYYAAWLCRFVSVDPLQFKYPHYTPFQYAGNKPISYIDLDGLEPIPPQVQKFADYTESLMNDAYNDLKDFSKTVIEISKGVAKGSFNLLVSMTMAGQAENTVISRDELYNQNGFESTLGFDPIKYYKQKIETYNSGTIEKKAQLSTELLGAGILIFEGAKQSKGIVTKFTWASQEFSQAALNARKA